MSRPLVKSETRTHSLIYYASRNNGEVRIRKYLGGFVIPVAPANLAKYNENATEAGEIWKEHGALEYYVCVGDDSD